MSNPPLHGTIDRSACCGILHPKRTSLGNTDAVCSHYRKKWTYLDGRWHKHNCLPANDPGAPKQRCVKCASAYSNISLAHHLKPFLEIGGFFKAFFGFYCTFDLNRCTRNRAAYISTFRYTNLMLLGCVESFSVSLVVHVTAGLWIPPWHLKI